MKPSELEISLLVKSYDKKITAENCRNFHVAEKRIASKLSKILIQNFDSTNKRLELRLFQNLTSLYFTFFEN